jgi:O-antigen/teichoic acid export membrane protein
LKLRSFINAGMGPAGAQIISLSCLPFLTRLYLPADFAPWALGLAFVVFLGAVATLRYDLALVVEREAQDASALFWLMFILLLVVFACAVLAMTLAAHFGWLFRESQIHDSMYLAGGWLLLFMLTQIWSCWHLHHGAFLIISIAQLGNAVAMNTIQFYGAMAHEGGGFWLIAGSIGGQTVALVVFLASGLRTDMHPMGFSACAHRIRGMAWKHRRFVQYSLPYTFFGAIRDRLPVLLLGFWGTSRELGLFSQAWRLSNVPAGLTGSAIRPVLFHGAAEHGLAVLEKQIGRILTLLILLGTPLLAVLAHRSEDIFGFVLGERWRAIGPFLAIMAFPALAFSLSNWMDRLLDATGKQHLNLWTEMACGLSSTLGLVLVLISGAGLLWAVVTQSVLLTLNYLFFVYLTYRVAGYDRGVLVRLLMLAIGLYLGVSFLMQGIWPGIEGTE